MGGGYVYYVIKRVKRILIPTWLFLIAYYGVLISYFLLKGKLDSFNVNEMVRTFALQTGWYVWVMRVFLITALIAPFIRGINEKINKWLVVLLCAIILITYEFVHVDNNGSVGYYLTMTIPYIVIFAMGMIIKDFNIKQLLLMSFVLLAVSSGFGYKVTLDNGSFLCTNNYKCPPLLYFSCFGLGCSMVFWLLKDPIYNLTKTLRIDKLMTFIGSHTMWFYLLHIPVVMVAVHLPVGKFLQFVFTLVITAIITFIFVSFIEKVVMNHLKSESAKKNVKLIFLG